MRLKSKQVQTRHSIIHYKAGLDWSRPTEMSLDQITNYILISIAFLPELGYLIGWYVLYYVCTMHVLIITTIQVVSMIFFENPKNDLKIRKMPK